MKWLVALLFLFCQQAHALTCSGGLVQSPAPGADGISYIPGGGGNFTFSVNCTPAPGNTIASSAFASGTNSEFNVSSSGTTVSFRPRIPGRFTIQLGVADTGACEADGTCGSQTHLISIYANHRSSDFTTTIIPLTSPCYVGQECRVRVTGTDIDAAVDSQMLSHQFQLSLNMQGGGTINGPNGAESVEGAFVPEVEGQHRILGQSLSMYWALSPEVGVGSASVERYITVLPAQKPPSKGSCNAGEAKGPNGETCGEGPSMNSNGGGTNGSGCPPQPGTKDSKVCQGDPVNVGTGAFFQNSTDFAVRGNTEGSSLEFSRSYKAHAATDAGDFGPNWHHSFETKLLTEQGGDNLIWIDREGSPWRFVKSWDGAYFATEVPSARIVVRDSPLWHYELSLHNGTKIQFSRGKNGTLSGRFTKLKDRNGEEISAEYSPSGLLQGLWVNGFSRIGILRNEQGRISQVIRDSLAWNYTYNPEGRLSSVTDPSGRVWQYFYNEGQADTHANGMMSGIRDPLGRESHFTYFDSGRIKEQVLPGNARFQFSYSSPSGPPSPVTMKAPNGGETRYYFDSLYRTTKIVHPDGAKEYRTFFPQGLIKERRHEFFGTTSYEYDGQGLLTKMKRPGETISTEIQNSVAFGVPTRITPPVGAPTIYSLHATTGDVMQISRAGLSLAFTRDAFGGITSVSNGKTTYNYQRDGSGLLTGVFDSHNPETRSYDSRRRLVNRSFASGRSLQYIWDDFDRLKEVIDSDGPDTEYFWDAGDRLTRADLKGNTETATTLYAWDDRDRLISETNALGQTTTYQFDPIKVSPNPISITDPAGHITRFEYDSMDRKIKEIDQNGAVTKFHWDKAGNFSGIIDALGNRTTYHYDRNGRRVQEIIDSVAGTTQAKSKKQYFYDQAGRLVRELRVSSRYPQGENHSVNYEYDELDRVIKKTLIRESQTSSVVEDVSTFTWENQLDAELLATASNGVSSLGFSYVPAPPFSLSAFSQAAAQVGNPLNLIEGSFSIDRDTSGQISGVSSQSGSIFSQTNDPAGRLLRVQSGGLFDAQIGYDGFGRRSSIQHLDGVQGSWAYDLLHRITAINWTGGGIVPVSQNLTYSLAGNITQLARETGTTNISYDPKGQIVSSTGQYARSFAYDALGNRLQDSINGAGSFISNYLVSNGVSSFQADPDGFGNTIQEVTGGVTKTFGYRPDGRMSFFSDGTTQATYYLDALGRRVAKAISKPGENFTNSYLHLGLEDRILQAKNGVGEVTTYLDGAFVDDHLGEINQAGAKTYLKDHLGSILNSAAAGVWRSFGLFGETSADFAVSPSMSPVMYGFAGYQYDGVSRWYLNGPRGYIPELGRWGQQEPKGQNGPNLYRYAKGNPLKYVDPDGYADKLPGPEGGTYPGDCGSGWSERIPDKVGSADLSNACFFHDACYANCEKTKEQCDTQFKKDIQAACVKAPTAQERTNCGALVSELYYQGVDKLGGGPHKSAQGGCSCKR